MISKIILLISLGTFAYPWGVLSQSPSVFLLTLVNNLQFFFSRPNDRCQSSVYIIWFQEMEFFALALVWLSWLVGCPRLKGCRFDPQSGHKPRLWVQSLVRACMRGSRSMFFSHNDVFSPPLSFPLSLKSIIIIIKHILRWGLKKQKWNFVFTRFKKIT